MELRIVEPTHDKNFMIAFTCDIEKECRIYGNAIVSALNDASIYSFHQIGTNPRAEYAPGYHAFEVSGEIPRLKLEGLIPNIRAEARKWLVTFEENASG